MRSLSRSSTLARAYLLMKHFELETIEVWEFGVVVGYVALEDIKRVVKSRESDVSWPPLVVEHFMTLVPRKKVAG